MMESKHADFSMSSCGLVISIQYPFIGASPDSLASCSCCVVEKVVLKWNVLTVRDRKLDEAAENSKFCLLSEDGVLNLSRSHAYYTQIQTQMNLCGKSYCDLFVWTEKGFHCQRVLRDTLLWEQYVAKAEMVFCRK